MKFRLTLWLGGAALVAALPAWADSVHYNGVADNSFGVELSTKPAANYDMTKCTYPRAGLQAKPVSADPNAAYVNPYFEFTEEPPNVNVSASVIDKSRTERKTPPNTGFRPEDAPRGLAEHFVEDAAFEASGSTRSLALDMLFFSSASLGDTGMQSAILSESEFHDSTSSIADAGKDGSSDRGESLLLHTRNHRLYMKRAPAVSVQEPGSFSLLLLGLAEIGFLGFRCANKIMVNTNRASSDTAKYRTEHGVLKLAVPGPGPYRF
jgi:hypothetical protein